MSSVTRIVRSYGEYIEVLREMDGPRFLFDSFKKLTRQMMDEGRVILSYKWTDMDSIEFLKTEWHKYKIVARVIYVGKRKVKDARFRNLLRRGFPSDIVIFKK